MPAFLLIFVWKSIFTVQSIIKTFYTGQKGFEVNLFRV
jgi:hypothetical protein